MENENIEMPIEMNEELTPVEIAKVSEVTGDADSSGGGDRANIVWGNYD